MSRPSINCDLGERGAEHPVDCALLELIDVANIACGGHAGDAASVRFYRKLAERRGVAVSAHLSYPDPAGFGRKSVELPPDALLASLDGQLRLLPEVGVVKLHGALYNDAAMRGPLASLLAAWMRSRGASAVITMHACRLAESCAAVGIRVIPEAFVERRYARGASAKHPTLVARGRADAVIEDIEEAMEQARNIVSRAAVRVLPSSAWVPLRAETLCVHSDSPIALELVRTLRAYLDAAGEEEA